MPTQEDLLENGSVLVVWKQPLTSGELLNCFQILTTMIDEAGQTVHILFEISDAGSIPADAPLIAIRSGFLTKRNTGKVAVIGMNAFPQMLAGVASRVTNKEIRFFLRPGSRHGLPVG